MNTIKFRPAGQPIGFFVRVRVSQSKRAIYGYIDANGNRRAAQSVSVARANKVMLRKGFLRAGVRS